ncbi:hypothetical protein [uncultured Gammaproteobacteria bacterium]|nr:hypothetical protein [uncultured Gammaproteobacteria bacterium]
MSLNDVKLVIGDDIVAIDSHPLKAQTKKTSPSLKPPNKKWD